MKKALLMALVVLLIAALSLSAFASSSNPVASDITATLTGANVYSGSTLVGRGAYGKTTVPYTATWVRITTEAQYYPSGNPLISAWSSTNNNSSSVEHLNTEIGYTGKITAYGAHSVYNNGKTAIRYTTSANI
jgi:hypothetical protein